mmetsp:Transcript_41927/g.119895  ORF Transcript_41927/g.119895 Transcript_41927/m.119895 type:complete len:131 (+) Transcript_41927:341-733(+)
MFPACVGWCRSSGRHQALPSPPESQEGLATKPVFQSLPLLQLQLQLGLQLQLLLLLLLLAKAFFVAQYKVSNDTRVMRQRTSGRPNTGTLAVRAGPAKQLINTKGPKNKNWMNTFTSITLRMLSSSAPRL